jgi:uncharacterized membrane-anchored protein YitT (DUF2179 family)
MKNKNKVISIIAIILGVILFIIALEYWTTSAGHLPSFLPGFKAGSAVIHLKHGIAAFLLALVLFAFAWFKGGKKSTDIQN